MSNSLYETDFYAWANEQAALLRAGRLADADIANIAEEIDTMGRGEKRELTNRLAVLLAHLLKWQAQPERRGRSWLLAIREQRRQIARLLVENPSLRPHLDSVLAEAYGDATIAAARDVDCDEDGFPATLHWTCDEIMHGELVLDHGA
jgi:hypothetical protein